MSWSAVVTMLLVTAVVWGGFILALLVAIRGERRRSRPDSTSVHSDPLDSRSHSEEAR